jgi:polysaccharide deacetylase 2 family uncharacterized protein YibQ
MLPHAPRHLRRADSGEHSVARLHTDDQAPPRPAPRHSRGWRALAVYWLVVLLAAGAGGGTLAWLGPVPAGAVHSNAQDLAAATPALPPAAASKLPPPAPNTIPNPPNSRIPAPDPALQETFPGPPEQVLPRIGADGRLPMDAYAAGWNPSDRRPRVAVLLANMGMSGTESEEAINTLPEAVSLAFSPYAVHPERLLELARASGHELLVSIPMEPQGYSLNDPGPSALMTGLAPAENAARLRHVLSLFAGYVGATGAMGNGLRGERYAASGQMPPLLDELAKRGVLYIDPRPGGTLPATPNLASRAVDLVLDEPPVRTELEAKLAQLEQIARDRGSALGLAGAPSPVTTERIAAWATGLTRRGVVLVPVSALVPRSQPIAQARP